MVNLIFCPFCNQQSVPATKSLKTVRNASRQGRGVSHVEEVLIVLGYCINCRKTKKEIQSAFNV